MFSELLFVRYGNEGNKETQFHGSEGKKAAKAVCVEKKPVSDTDDRKPSIVWRNDGQYFATNTVFNDVRFVAEAMMPKRS